MPNVTFDVIYRVIVELGPMVAKIAQAKALIKSLHEDDSRHHQSSVHNNEQLLQATRDLIKAQRESNAIAKDSEKRDAARVLAAEKLAQVKEDGVGKDLEREQKLQDLARKGERADRDGEEASQQLRAKGRNADLAAESKRTEAARDGEAKRTRAVADGEAKRTQAALDGDLKRSNSAAAAEAKRTRDAAAGEDKRLRDQVTGIRRAAAENDKRSRDHAAGLRRAAAEEESLEQKRRRGEQLALVHADQVEAIAVRRRRREEAEAKRLEVLRRESHVDRHWLEAPDNIARSFREGFREIDQGESKVRRLQRAFTQVRHGMNFDYATRSFREGFREIEHGESKVHRLSRAFGQMRRAMTDDDDGGRGGFLTRFLARMDSAGDSVTRGFGNMMRAMRRWLVIIGLVIAVLGPAIALLGALGGAAIGVVNALGSLAGSVAALPGLFLAASLGIGALIVAIQPLVAVFKAYQAHQQAATIGSRELAESQKDAARHTRTAANAYRQASQAVSDAQFTERRSLVSLNEARRESLRNLQDLRVELARASLNEEGAILSVKQAEADYRRVLADGNATNLDREQGLLRVKQAEFDLNDVRTRNKRLAEDAAVAEKRGVEGSLNVVDARRAAERATREVGDAVKHLADTTEDLARAQREQAAGGSQALSTYNQLLDALDKLSPSARLVAVALLGMADGWKAVQRNVSERFFAPIVKQIGNLKGILGGPGGIDDLLSTAASAMGKLAAKGIEMVTSGPWRRDFHDLAISSATILTSLGDAGLYVADALRNVAIAARPFTEWVSEAIRGVGRDFAEWAEKARKNGSLREFLETTRDRMQQLWRIATNLSLTFASLYTASKDFTTWLLDGIEEATVRWKKWGDAIDQSGFKQWLEDIKPLLHEAWKFIAAFGAAFADIAADPRNIEEARRVLQVLSEDVLPALVDLVGQLSKSGALGDIIKLIADLLRAMADFLAAGGVLMITLFIKALLWLSTAALQLLSIKPLAGIFVALGTALSIFAAAAVIARFTGLLWLIEKLRGLWGIALLLNGPIGNLARAIRGFFFGPTGAALSGAGAAGAARAAGGAGAVAAEDAAAVALRGSAVALDGAAAALLRAAEALMLSAGVGGPAGTAAARRAAGPAAATAASRGVTVAEARLLGGAGGAGLAGTAALAGGGRTLGAFGRGITVTGARGLTPPVMPRVLGGSALTVAEARSLSQAGGPVVLGETASLARPGMSVAEARLLAGGRHRAAESAAEGLYRQGVYGDVAAVRSGAVRRAEADRYRSSVAARADARAAESAGRHRVPGETAGRHRAPGGDVFDDVAETRRGAGPRLVYDEVGGIRATGAAAAERASMAARSSFWARAARVGRFARGLDPLLWGGIGASLAADSGALGARDSVGAAAGRYGGAVLTGAGIGAFGGPIGAAAGAAAGAGYSFYKDPKLRQIYGTVARSPLSWAVNPIGATLAHNTDWFGDKKEDKKTSKEISGWASTLYSQTIGAYGKLLAKFWTQIAPHAVEAYGKYLWKFWTQTVPHAVEAYGKYLWKFWTHTVPKALEVVGSAWFDLVTKRIPYAISFLYGVMWVFWTKKVPAAVGEYFNFVKKVYTEWLPAAVGEYFSLARRMWTEWLPAAVGEYFHYAKRLWTEWLPGAGDEYFHYVRKLWTEWLPAAAGEYLHYVRKLWTEWLPAAVGEYFSLAKRVWTEWLPAAVGEYFHYAKKLWTEWLPGLISGFYTYMWNFWTEKMPHAVGGFFSKMISNIVAWAKKGFQGGVDWASDAKQSGGLIGGAADGRVDQKAILATPGEFMVRKRVVDKPGGKDLLNAINEERINPEELYAALNIATRRINLPVNAPVRASVSSTTVNNTNSRTGMNVGDITINNPVRERSDRSMRRTLQTVALMSDR